MNYDYLKKIYNDDTLHNFFKIEEIENSYIIKEYIGFDEQEIYLPEFYKGKKIKKVESGLFLNCHWIEELIIDSHLEIIPDSFCSGAGIKKCILPDTIKKIEARAFYNTKLTKIILPNNVREIGKDAFLINYIEELELPRELEILGSNAVKNRVLRYVKCYEKLNEIGQTAIFCTEYNSSSPLTIECTAGSAAQKYARIYNFKCVRMVD